MITTPGELMDQIDKLKLEIEEAGDDYRKHWRPAIEAEIAYEKAIARERLKILAAAQDADKRPPAEDLRDAMAHQNIDSEVWAGYLMAKARLDAIDRWLRTRSSMLSACQTQLNHLDAELRNT